MKRVALRLLLILFALLILAGAEAAMRLLWTPPLLPGEELALVAIDPFRVENGIARTSADFTGAMVTSTFLVPKPAELFRVVALGGSTTRGFPFPAEVAWPALLERRLQIMYPQRKIEVINLGGNSYGSGRILALMRAMVKYQPDLFIVATGHNEFVEDSFRAAVALQPRPLSWLRRLYLARAMKVLLPVGREREPRIVSNSDNAGELLFSPLADNTVYRVTDPQRESIMAGSAANFAEIRRLAVREEIPLLFCTVPSNLTDWPPDHDPARPAPFAQRAQWEKLWEEGRELVARQDLAAALQPFIAASRLWEGNAEFSYEFAQLLLHSGELAAARPWLVRARDLDPSPVRATTAMQGLLRQAATGRGVYFVDLAARFDEMVFAGRNIWELVVDYVHPSPQGHLEIAAIVAESVAKIQPGWGEPATAADFDRAERERSRPLLMGGSPDLFFVRGEVFERKGLFSRAAEMYRLSIEKGNRGPQDLNKLAMVLAKGGDLPAAIEVAKSLNADHPDWDRSALLLGYLYEESGQAGVAADWYQRAIAAGRREIELYSSTVRMLFTSGQGGKALQLLEEGMTLYPDNCQLTSQLGMMLESRGDLSRAEAGYRQLLAKDPSCQPVWEGLGLVLMNQSRWQEAADVFHSALRQKNPLPFHHLNLGVIYSQGLGERERAAEEYRTFLALQPEQWEMVPPSFRPGLSRKAGMKSRGE